LPQGYPNGTQQYPLLVFLHGIGELGDGTMAELPYILRHGPPQIIANGAFPVSFTVNGQTFGFLVISPQFIDTPTVAGIDDVINYAESHYQVDLTRVYLTGMSMGGGGVWLYSGSSAQPYGRKLAAIVPVSGASAPDLTAARVIAEDNLPVWATHNNGDPVIPASYTQTMVSYINQPTAPKPAAQMTIFQANTHDSWDSTYDPKFVDKVLGSNIYIWMLSHQDFSNTLPVVLSAYQVAQVGSQQVLVSWSTSAEENDAFFTVERSTDSNSYTALAQIPARNIQTGGSYSFSDLDPAEGMNFYRLSLTDLDQKTTYFPVKAIDLQPQDHPSLRLFPNPVTASATVQIDLVETGNMELRILDVGGRLLEAIAFNKPTRDWKMSLPLPSLPPGFYILQLVGAKTKYNLEFIKQ
jgi:dienelactone hydrolase